VRDVDGRDKPGHGVLLIGLFCAAFIHA